MFFHVQKLINEIVPDEPDPLAANALQEGLGGQFGEMRNKLICVVRDTPYNLIHLRNMTQLCEAGATILPASPAWYFRPKTLEELADTVVARILQNLGIEQDIAPEWQAD